MFMTSEIFRIAVGFDTSRKVLPYCVGTRAEIFDTRTVVVKILGGLMYLSWSRGSWNEGAKFVYTSRLLVGQLDRL